MPTTDRLLIPTPAALGGGAPNDVPGDLQAIADRLDVLGGIGGLFTTLQRDALAGVQLWNGRTIWNTTTLRLEVYKGAVLGWQPAGAPDLAAAGASALQVVRADQAGTSTKFGGYPAFVFADAAARDAEITVPVSGLAAWLTGSKTRTLYDGAAWIIAEVWGAGSPEGVVTAQVGARYYRTDGAAGTTLYVKESGAGNVGWRAHGAALTSDAGNMASNTTLPAGVTTTMVTTGSLAVGTWLVTAGTSINGSAGTDVECSLDVGTATATFAGRQSSAFTIGPANQLCIAEVACIATVTVAGTLIWRGISNVNASTVRASGPTNGNPKMTGYTAVKIA